MLSTNTIDETTILLEKDSAPKCFSKNDSFAKKSCLAIFAVVCGLAIVFAVLMTKWYLISQSVITPTVSHDVEFYPNAKPPSREEFEAGVNSNINMNEKKIDEDGPPAFGSFDKVVDQMPPPPPPPPSSDQKTIDGVAQPGSQQAETPDHDGDEDIHEDRPPPQGATAPQLGKAFPLTILARIAWKDLSNMLTFGSGPDHDFIQSVSMMPVYINEQDCIYAVNYFENEVIGGVQKDCQYVDLNEFVFGKNECEGDNDHDQSQSKMSRITNKITDYFYENYANYLIDCEIVDVRMIKYLSNGTRYSGLHSENHYIDGKRIIGPQIDYVGIVFLNDNFDGGNLQFISPKSIDIINAQIGNGVLFGGDLDYSHRVTPVTNGDRYVLKIIFNKN